MQESGAVHYVALAVPAMLGLIAAEAALAWRLGRQVYRPAAAMSDIACGIVQQLAMLFLRGALVGAYTFVFLHLRFWSFAPGSPWVWILGLLGLDLMHYWWHRASHHVNVLWAAHVVHHQSEDFNLAVSLRHSAFTPLTALPFYLPLAIAGIPPHVYAAAHAGVVLYQFWVHTELVGPLPSVEYVLVTPSVHRVHHALNTPYLDKNFGGVLTLWDRLFGTYRAEDEAPVYGSSSGLDTFSPLRVQVDHAVRLARRAARLTSLGDRVSVWFKGPSWKATVEEANRVQRCAKYDPATTRARILAGSALFAAALVATTLLMLLEPRIPRAVLYIVAPLITVILALALSTVVTDEVKEDGATGATTSVATSPSRIHG